jgi:hypothetical protein
MGVETWVSRPEGFHLKPLAEPDMTLSSHPAPVIQPRTLPQTASAQTAWDDSVPSSQANVWRV